MVEVRGDKLTEMFPDRKLFDLKGYSERNKKPEPETDQDKRRYKEAKTPCTSGWNAEDYRGLSDTEITNWIKKQGWIGLRIPEGSILVDVDNHAEGKLIYDMLHKENLKFHGMRTPNGYQFFFKDAGNVTTQNVDMVTVAGFVVDYRLSAKGYTVLPLGRVTEGRSWIHVCEDELDYMPSCFNPMKPLNKMKDSERPFQVPIIHGTHNDTLHKHTCRLQEFGVSDDEIMSTILFMGEYVCDTPYDDEHSLGGTVRGVLDKYPKGKKIDVSSGGHSSTNSIPHNDMPEWEEPIWFDENKAPSFPVELFPDWIGDYAKDISERVQVPIDAPCMGALAVLSASLAKKFVVHLPQHGWTERINLYVVSVMEPSEKKSENHRLMTSPINEFERQEKERLKPLYDAQRAERELKLKRREHLSTQYAKSGKDEVLKEFSVLRAELDEEEAIILPDYVTTDCTPEKLASLVQENGEKMAILSAEGGILDIMAGRYNPHLNLDLFLNGYTGDRTKIHRSGNHEAITIEEPALTFGLFVQPTVIQNISPEIIRRGGLARFLYAIPEAMVGRRKLIAHTTKPELKERYDAGITRLLKLKHEGVQLHLDPEAYAVFNHLWQRIEDGLGELGELSSKYLNLWGGKLAGTMLRISALIHVANHVHGEIPITIKKDTMVQVVKAASYFIDHAKVLYDSLSVNETIEDAKYVLKWIQKEDVEVVDKQTLWQAVKKRIPNAEEFNTILDVLEKRGFIRQSKDGRKNVIIKNPLLAPKKLYPNSPSSLQLVKKNDVLGELGEETLSIHHENIVEPLKEVAATKEETMWL